MKDNSDRRASKDRESKGCASCLAYLSPFYDGELAAAEQRGVEAHLKACASCEAKLESFGVLSNVLCPSPIAEAVPGSVGDAAGSAQEVAEAPSELIRARLLEAAAAGRLSTGIPRTGKLSMVQKFGAAAAGFLVYFGMAQVLGTNQSQDTGVTNHLGQQTRRVIGSDDPSMQHVVRSLEDSMRFLVRESDQSRGSGRGRMRIPGDEPTPFEFSAEAQLTRYVAMQEMR